MKISNIFKNTRFLLGCTGGGTLLALLMVTWLKPNVPELALWGTAIACAALGSIHQALTYSSNRERTA